MVAAVQPQFAVGDRVRVAPIKPTDSHLWGKEGIVQSGLRANGTLTVNLDGGKLRSFRPLELEAIPHETPQTTPPGASPAQDRDGATGTGDNRDRPPRRRKAANRKEVSDETGRERAGESPTAERNEVVSGARLGDRVRGKHLRSGELIEGIVTSIGLTLLVLNNSRSTAIEKHGSEIVENQAISEDDDYLIQCVGLPWYDQAEIAFRWIESGFTSDSDYLISNVDLTPLGDYRGWEIGRYKEEVTVKCDGRSWSCRINGFDPHKHACWAINVAQDAIEALQRVEQPTKPSRKVRQASPFAEAYEAEAEAITADNNGSAIIETPPESITATLIREINTLYGQIEEAEEVAVTAARSALEFAREMGDRLLQLKKEAGHGNWESVRAQIQSPRTGKNLPSSTATLYQRISKRWAELEEAGANSLRQATELLKSDRAFKSATDQQTAADLPLEPPPQTQRDLGEAMDRIEVGIEERKAAALDYGPGVAPETAQALANAGVIPCKPSITPEEFNREIWGENGPPVLNRRTCKTCANQVRQEGSGFTCEAGIFQGVQRHPVIECSRFSDRPVEQPSERPPVAGLSILESTVWAWLNFHSYEATEDAVKDAAQAINEFLTSQFLEANDDE